jgi:hypothetical protein
MYGQALGLLNLFRPVGMHHSMDYAGSINVFSKISRRQFGHFAGSSGRLAESSFWTGDSRRAERTGGGRVLAL